MATWKDFHEFVLPNVQGCPVGIVNSAIRSACIEFCEKSLLWQQKSAKTDIIAGEARYGFAPPAGARVVQPTFASINDEILLQTNLQDLDDLYPSWRTYAATKPTAYFMDGEDTIRLVGKPLEDIPASLEVHVALKPTRDAAECPDFLLEDWAEVIASGALYRLHAMVGKVWAEPTLSAFHNKLFRAGASLAKGKAAKSRQRSTKIVVPRRFGDY